MSWLDPKHFEHLGDPVTSTGRPRAHLVAGMAASQAVYLPSFEERMHVAGWDNTAMVSPGWGAQAGFATSRKHRVALIVFMGSEGLQHATIPWWRNREFYRDWILTDALGGVPWRSPQMPAGIWSGAGFVAQARRLWPKVLAFAQCAQRQGLRVTARGHSLGGLLAEGLDLMLTFAGSPPDMTVGYESPRGLNRRGKRQQWRLRGSTGRAFTYVNTHGRSLDSVTLLPPWMHRGTSLAVGTDAGILVGTDAVQAWREYRDGMPWGAGWPVARRVRGSVRAHYSAEVLGRLERLYKRRKP